MVGIRPAVVPVATAIVFTAAAVAVLALARRLDAGAPIAAVALVAAFMSLDLAWNNAPHESTALPRERYEALRQDTANETVRLLKARLAGAAAPDRRDRVELIGIGYHWPNLSLAQGFDHVFGHNPLRLRWFYEATHVGDTVALPSQRTFSPLYPSYRSAFADLLGVRFIATGVPVERIDSSLKPGDLTLIARTKDAYVYENPRALPRVMLLTDWQLADFEELARSGWPAVDPRRTVLLEAGRRSDSRAPPRPARAAPPVDRYANTEVVVEVDAPAGGILLLNDVWHPWWRATRRRRRYRDHEGRCDLPRRGGSARPPRGALQLPSVHRRLAEMAGKVTARISRVDDRRRVRGIRANRGEGAPRWRAAAASAATI